MRSVKIQDEIYGKTIHLTFGTNDEVKKWYKKMNITDTQQMSEFFEAYVCFIERDVGKYLVRDVHIHFTDYGFTKIVHETSHLTFKVLSDVGIQLSQETTEAYAYYQDWIAGKIRDQFEKWTKPNKRKKNVSK